jgi:hypothetical protein
MKITGFLLVDQSGADTWFLKSEPATRRGQLAIKMNIEIPDAIFHPPKIAVQVVIDESIIPQIRAINEHCEALQEAGVKIRLVDEREGA